MDNITATLTTVRSRESAPQNSSGDEVERARNAALSVYEHRRVNENLKILLEIFRRDLLCLQLKNFTDQQQCPPEFEAKLDIDDAGFILELIVQSAMKFQDQGYLDRLELQFQTILAAFEVLRAWDSRIVEPRTHKVIEEHLYKHFESVTNCKQRFCHSDDTSYQWHRCAYLLSINTEFFKNFQIDESKVFRVLAQGLTLISIGLSLAGPSIGGSLPRLDKTLIELNGALKPISKKPKQRFEVLFVLQELVHFALALSHNVDDDQYDVAPVAQEIYDAVLSTATYILRTNTEKEPSEPLKGLNDVKAALKRGAPALESFHLVYGSIDCAQQVLKLENRFGKTKQQYEFVQELHRLAQRRTRVRNKVILGKANEYLARYAIQETPVNEKFSIAPRSRQGSANISQRGSIAYTTSSSRSGQPSTDWIEPSFEVPPLSSAAEKGVIKFAGKAASKAGLSPNCKMAYFLTFQRDLRVGDMQGKEAQYLTKCTKNMDIRDVALSDHCLVFLYRDQTRPEHSKHRVRVVSVRHEGKEIDVSLRSNADTQRTFLPGCIATYHYEKSESSIFEEPVTRLIIGATTAVAEQSAPTLLLIDVGWNNGVLQETRRRLVEPESSLRLAGENLVSAEFDSRGTKLSCITTCDRVVTWTLDRDGFVSGFYESPRLYIENKQGHQGLTSVSRFNPPESPNSYLFCTTWPGRCVPPDRGMIQADWPIVMPAPDNGPTMHDELIHKFTFFEDTLQPQITGTVSPDGKIVAMRDCNGKVTLVGLKNSETGGLVGWSHDTLQATLRKQERASSASMKFCRTDAGLHLFALDENGTYIKKTFLEQ